MKYTLKSELEDFKNTLEFEAETLDEVLENIRIFLMGTGFTWVQGDLAFVEEETYVAPHSSFYFDTERNR